MSDQLVVLSDTKNVTGQTIVIEDYNKHPVLCRSGIWVGWLTTFTETVTLQYQHTEDPLYVGWAINGTTVIDPGYSSGTPPWGVPCPGVPSVAYCCPVDGFLHNISLTSTSGDPYECLTIQVLYRGPNDANNPAHVGPFMSVCLAGSEIDWPAKKVAESERCMADLWARLGRLIEIAHVQPGDPVEWLGSLPSEESIRLQAEVNTLEQLDVTAQPALAKAIRADLTGMLSARMPGAKGSLGLASERRRQQR
jgi:hypothetical protein